MILVTGGTGLTGSFVASELMRRGLPFCVYGRPASLERVRAVGMDVVEGDLRKPETLRRAMKGTTGVVHAACTFTDAQADVAAMEALLHGWAEGPFVYVSSLDVYGYATAVPVTENTPLDASFSEYGRGKLACERMLQEHAAARGRTDWTVLRAPYIFGPHERSCERLINDKLRQGLPIVLPGVTPSEWSAYRDAWIDVRDLAWVIAESVLRPSGGAMNALSGHFRWHEVYQNLARLLGSASTVVHRDLASISDDELPRKTLYAQNWYFSNALLRERLKFHPQFTLLETLEAVATMHTCMEADSTREARPTESSHVYRAYVAGAGFSG